MNGRYTSVNVQDGAPVAESLREWQCLTQHGECARVLFGAGVQQAGSNHRADDDAPAPEHPGARQGFLLQQDRSLGASFVDFSWNHIPEWDPNLNFYRLVLGGPLHLAPPGVTVGDGIPYVRDVAVRDDWEKEARPGGVPNPHTDRGADQIEAGLATSVDDRDEVGSTVALWAAPLRNPAGGAAALQVRNAWEGRLELELYDVAGRLVHRSMREVPSRWQGVLEWPRGNVSGALFYRVHLSGRDGMREEVRGRITIVR
jgi:hypothetical protein